ncbi:MAG: excinuclease ABC subunit UvrA [Deltaproteobacteria bacterium]|nr:excinuclease ABC subunit UvrA [Deltaproteobacteria bacterium]
MGPPYITIRGAREHNLKDIDVQIPRDRLVVITGLSGSGKSTLAFDTIYAEGQRRYVESLSAYARQFLEQMDKPDVDLIEGLSPAISIEQKTTSRNPRSTVGTVTEIYDYYRLLFARIGIPHCYQCGKSIEAQTVTQMVDRLHTFPEGSKVAILAPIVRNRKGEYAKELRDLRKAGFVRVRIDGAVHDLADEITLNKKKKHTIDLFIDRLVMRPDLGNRLADSLETALRYGHGIAKVETGGETFLLSEKAACIECGISYPEITPQMFSFNNPLGACTGCGGLGTKLYFDPDLIVPNYLLSLREGAIAPWHSTTSTYYLQVFENLARHYGFDIYTPWKKLPETIRHVILYGSGADEIRFTIDRHGRRETYVNPFRGVIPLLEQRYNETGSDWIREEIERVMNVRPCPTCNGARLRKESLHVKVHDLTISALTALSVETSLQTARGWALTKREEQIAGRILKEIGDRLTFLHNVGLGYLTLDRSAATLSGGEGQRIRLATQIGSALTGVLYVLDEPSIGLHQRDNHRLLETLTSLRDLGNTVLIVEHDRDTILAADHVIDMGPGAGIHGGHIVATGTPTEIMRHPSSVTGQYLAGKRRIALPTARRQRDNRCITILKARQHNLKAIDVAFPVGCFTCITGVSGSGKSTLVNETLYPALCQRLYRSKITAGTCDGIEGAEHFDKVINIDQSPIGRTPRSNPATYTGVFTHIRDLFAQLPVAQARGYKSGRFSFNVKGGRCEACEGDGIIRIEMQFLPDVYVECEVCRGKRFTRETLEVAYKGSNISDVLAMTVEQAGHFFEQIPAIRTKLQTLRDVGLNYIELGQSATTLSGGEAQRIKLARELAKRPTGRTLYILDEPTTGLHFADIEQLLTVLNRLADAGNTVVVIEHNMDVIKSADYVIDLGPEGGDRGGTVVAAGTPEDLTRVEGSYTGHYLKHVLEIANQGIVRRAGAGIARQRA